MGVEWKGARFPLSWRCGDERRTQGLSAYLSSSSFLCLSFSLRVGCWGVSASPTLLSPSPCNSLNGFVPLSPPPPLALAWHANFSSYLGKKGGGGGIRPSPVFSTLSGRESPLKCHRLNDDRERYYTTTVCTTGGVKSVFPDGLLPFSLKGDFFFFAHLPNLETASSARETPPMLERSG